MFSVEFMACRDSPHWHLFAVTENTRKRMQRKEKSPLRGLKRTTAGTRRRSGRHQTCRAPGAGCSNASMGTGRGETLHWVPLELQPGTAMRTEKVKFQHEFGTIYGWNGQLHVLSHSVASDSCNSMDCSPPDSSVPRILQARILEWVAMPSSRGSSQPRDRTPHLLHCRRVLHHLSHQGTARWAPNKHYYLHSSGLWTRFIPNHSLYLKCS